MFIFLVPILLLLSCYVATSDIKPENKTTYFIAVGIIIILVIIFGVIFVK